MANEVLLLLLLFLVVGCSSVNILIYAPSYFDSYLLTFTRIANTLTDAGHHVVMLVPEYKPTNMDDAVKHAKVIRMDMKGNNGWKNLLDDYGSKAYNIETIGLLGRIRWQNMIASLCKNMLEHKAELESLRSYNFTIGFSGAIDYCGLGLMRMLHIPNHIWVSDGALNEVVAFLLGVPHPVAYVPTVDENNLGNDMSLMDRVHNSYMWETSYYINVVYGGFLSTLAFRRHSNVYFPNVRELATDSALCFVNSNELLDMARPILHKTIYIGGLAIRNNTSLPEEFAKLIQKGDEGVVVVSLNNLIPSSSMPTNIRINLFRAFAEFPQYQFIVAIDDSDEEGAEMAKQFPNIATVHSIPKSNILGNSHVKLLITSGEMNDLMEATMKGVPSFVIPLIRDEFHNGNMVVKRGIGLTIAKHQLTQQQIIYSTLNKLLNSKKYQIAAKRFSAMLRNQATESRHQLIRWTKMVAEFGSLNELRPHGVSYNTIKYFILDVLITVILLGILMIALKTIIVLSGWYIGKKMFEWHNLRIRKKLN